MKFDNMHSGVSPTIKAPVLLAYLLPILLLVIASLPLSAQETDTHSASITAQLTTEQVVKNLIMMNLERARALHSYAGTRTYKLEYQGLPSNRNAEMVVDLKFRAPATKEFSIRSSAGSNMVIEKVFKKLLEAEKESLTEEAQRRTALNNDNYEFRMVGYESKPLGSTYVLFVNPKTANKFLYRGRIWVDAKDFAVIRLQAEPSKNPSLLVKNSEIDHRYTKVSDFWLPAHNRTITSIRFGGRAELTIEYSNYQITAADAVGESHTVETARLADTSHLQSSRDHK